MRTDFRRCDYCSGRTAVNVNCVHCGAPDQRPMHADSPWPTVIMNGPQYGGFIASGERPAVRTMLETTKFNDDVAQYVTGVLRKS